MSTRNSGEGIGKMVCLDILTFGMLNLPKKMGTLEDGT